MSSGILHSDNRTYPWTGCGQEPVGLGSYYHKEWSGENNQKGTPFTDHPYSMYLIENNTGKIRWSNPSWNYPQWGTIHSCMGGGFHSGLSPQWDDNDELKLLNKMADRIRGSSFNAGNLLAESKQTAALVTTTATRLAKFLHYVRDGNFYKATRILGLKRGDGHVFEKRHWKHSPRQAASNFILEVQYGWRPLLADVHDSMETLAKRIELPVRLSYKVRRSILVISSEPHETLQSIFFRKTKKTVWLKVTLASEPSLNTILHLNDPFSAIVEVTPWSFVADWFLPISDYFGALDFYRRFDIERIVRSEKVEWYWHLIGSTIPGYTVDDDTWQKEVRFTRSITGIPNYYNMPLPKFKPLNKAFSNEHLFNALALLSSTADSYRSKLKF